MPYRTEGHHHGAHGRDTELAPRCVRNDIGGRGPAETDRAYGDAVKHDAGPRGSSLQSSVTWRWHVTTTNPASHMTVVGPEFYDAAVRVGSVPCERMQGPLGCPRIGLGSSRFRTFEVTKAQLGRGGAPNRA